MWVILVFFILTAITVLLYSIAAKAESVIDANSSTHFLQFQRQYFAVFFLATFADWMQGPYVYKLYSYYGYTDPQIAVLYVIGFGSSVTFGTVVSSLADRLGRRKLCILYSILYSICCLTKVTSNYIVLLLGRILGGISTSILFSTFESWYVHQHTEKYNYPVQWINLTLAKATFYNGILAIVAGVVSNFVAEYMQLGPVSPFVAAIPILLLCGVLTFFTWDENAIKQLPQQEVLSQYKIVKLILFENNFLLLLMGLVQSLFESVMYTFVFLWTPILEPMSPPLGIVFSCFMICIMIGSLLYSFLSSLAYSASKLLTVSMVLALVALVTCSLATSVAEPLTQACFVAFLVFEVAVGVYFPAIGFLRSQHVPEEYRASVTSWFRVPMNLLTCSTLLWLRSSKAHDDRTTSGHGAFVMCSMFLIAATILSLCLTRRCKVKGQSPLLDVMCHPVL